MNLNTDHLVRCISTLEVSLNMLNQVKPESIEYEIFRNAVLKSLELTLETAVKMIRKVLKEYTGRPREIDALTFKDALRKDALRHAALHDIMSTDAVLRWIKCRDNRNKTAHDYGVGFAAETLNLMEGFINDAKTLADTLHVRYGHDNT